MLCWRGLRDWALRTGARCSPPLLPFIGAMISESWIRAVRWIGFLRGGISILSGLNHKE